MVLVIGGHQRSGTTLMKKLFNSRPDAFMTDEFGNLMVLNAPYDEYSRFIMRRWWRKRNSAILEQHPIKGVSMAQNLVFVNRYLRAIRHQQPNEVSVRVIENALKQLYPAKIVLGDKYPDHVFEVGRIVKERHLRGIFIFRDPRDVASSALKRSRVELRNSWPDEMRSPRLIAERWIYALGMVETYRDEIYTIRYEDLVTNPRPVLDKLAYWLGLDPDGFQHQLVRTTSIGKYRQGLTEAEVSEIVDVAGPAMQQLGYEI